MILVEGWVKLVSATEIERLRAAAIKMVHATKTSETGCLEYAFAIDLAETDVLRIIERWTDEAALAAHFATPHMEEFGQALADANIKGMLVKVYAGEEVRTLMER